MELSGVNRLLALAQEVGVRGAGNVERSKTTQREVREPSSERTSERIGREDADLKVSLSDFASRLAENLPAAAPVQPAVSTRTTSATASPESDSPRQPADQRQSGSRRSAGIAAYKRNAQAITGERIRVIA